jgi:two-component system response regulator HydG
VGGEGEVVRAFELGATDYVTKPYAAAILLARVRRLLQRGAPPGAHAPRPPAPRARTRVPFGGFVGSSAPMVEVYRRLGLAAESDVTVLLRGESGTGKEVAAASIHAASARRSGPFVAVNCSAFSETLLESELFGHVKGSFTGAVRDKPGIFEAASGGTLFLDEIGDVSPVIQVKLLRTLQEREVRRVGDNKSMPFDVRLVTATNQDLKKLVAEKKVREDFYYRIRVFEVQLPPLRARRADVPLLVDHFCAELSKERGKAIVGADPEALERLVAYDWPGNVRELRNAIESAFVTATGKHLRVLDLPPELTEAAPVEEEPTGEDAAERARILEILERHGGNRTAAAKELGMSRVTLWKRLRKYGVADD